MKGREGGCIWDIFLLPRGVWNGKREWMGMDGPWDIFAHRVYNGLMNTLLSSVSTADDDGDQLFSM